MWMFFWQDCGENSLTLSSSGFLFFSYLKSKAKMKDFVGGGGCLVAKLCWTLSTPCSVHGILQARILEWVAISFSGGSS